MQIECFGTKFQSRDYILYRKQFITGDLIYIMHFKITRDIAFLCEIYKIFFVSDLITNMNCPLNP